VFIVIEGLDGAGTTTQVARLADTLRRRSPALEVHTTREPSDGPIGVQIRQILSRRVVLPGGARMEPETLALLFAADRIDHLRAEVAPVIDRGGCVISDRYVHSSLAYQGEECDRTWVAAINARARDADVTLHLDVPIAECARRRMARGTAADLFENEAFLARVATGYDEAYHLRPSGVARIDGSGPIDEVTQRLVAALDAALVG
jgi:dTMP kinase